MPKAVPSIAHNGVAFQSVHNEAVTLVAQMTVAEKASLCSGRNFWFLQGIERLGLKSVMVTDGPHGLRKQGGAGDHLGLGGSVPATGFPTACALASSWDTGLLEAVGVALGEKAAAEQVALLLGPGLNIKRHPACGRNFEYFSEDPVLSGDLAGAMVRGVQSKGVGACLKHFAVNNQEQARMVTDVLVDDRTLREIYLRGFERAVKNSAPWSVMCAYNRVNGEYCGDSNFLLNKVLREDWGFNGLVVTDWGATNERVTGLAGGLDLEMPGSGGINDKLITQAVADGSLAEPVLDRAAERVTSLSLLGANLQTPETHSTPTSSGLDEEAHHQLARRAAAESAVLLKNDGVLPLVASALNGAAESIAVIGEFAKHPRYQGAGSSQVRPTQLDNAFAALAESLTGSSSVSGGNDGDDLLRYARGYDRKAGSHNNHDPVDEELLVEAEAIAQAATTVLLFVGLPAHYESEGFDRTHLRLPQQHDELISRVCAVNPNTIVVLHNGAPVLMPWIAKPRAVLECYLGGQAGGAALVDVLLGVVNPSGRLAETFPLAQSDVPADQNFPGEPRQVQYREGLYVGYRYFDSAEHEVLFPFGFGLGYTRFEFRDARVAGEVAAAGETIELSVTVANIGEVAGKEVVQVYSAQPESGVHRPAQELRGFAKVELQPGEEKTIVIELPVDDLQVWDAANDRWHLEEGQVVLRIGSSSRDIHFQRSVQIQGAVGALQDSDPVRQCYAKPRHPLTPTATDFTALYGKALPPAESIRPFHLNSTLGEVRGTRVGGQLHKSAHRAFGGGGESASDSQRLLVDALIEHMPLRSLMLFSAGKLSRKRLLAMIALMNRSPFAAVKALLSSSN